ncbi:hypothetical protein M406DRAFT_60079 [Cryphonectria parasitica EP155]|uniref:Polyketide synthase n=1 Tax=Cryphonectria parasitica (strain ATCC 38755 / EP155) TaxID=660469 RepID=A0A9P4Y271_CRYP1|nr:uncharacterized protein M406DRAFT_60079 [Cryphonectria parasitica EP155]KAF3765298.1 hypothetical protein M406DRAFT_60079 [Cryphonectria parasitica EP155]
MSPKADIVLLFGDQTGNIAEALQELNKLVPHHDNLQLLFTRSMRKMKLALKRTSPAFKPRLSPVTSLLELALELEKECFSGSPALAAALLCVVQLGYFIVHAEKNAAIFDTRGATHPKIVLFGVCVGLLTASAVACSRDLGELLSISDDIIQLAFNIGLEAAARSELIEPLTPARSWAFHVKGLTREETAEAIESFNNSFSLGNCSRAYMSASSPSGVTISGPPSTTEKLFRQTPSFHRAHKIALPIIAAYHAEHLDQVSIDRITDFVSSSLLHQSVKNKTLVSTSSGEPYVAETFGDLLRQVQADIFQHPICLDSAIQSLQRRAAPVVACASIGPVSLAESIKQALEKSGVKSSNAGLFHDNFAAKPSSNDVAIVGMAVRLPGSETLEEFWHLLEKGCDLHGPIPSDRFDLASHFDPTGTKTNSTKTPFGVFIDRPGYFDRHLFNMSPRECLQTDPQHRMLLLAVYEALEMSGSTALGNSKTIGTFIGQTGDDWREVNSSQNIDAYFIPGGMRAFGPGRLQYHFGFDGPSYSVDTACSSSASAVQLAVSALLAQECDMAVSGGVNFLSAPDVFAGLSRGGFLSSTGGCKTFDAGADGYCRADAVGVVILKRYADAVGDHDNIIGVIKAAMTNHSAEAVSITHPHAKTQERLFHRVLDKAGLQPIDVDYVELHGTGTQAGDVIEATSVTDALAKGGRPPSQPLYIGSVKPNLGHGEGGSGVTSLIKAALILRQDMLPPHIGIKDQINPDLPPLSQLNTHLSLGGTTPFPRHRNTSGQVGRPRTILINNFDAAGGNTSIVLQDAPDRAIEGTDSRCHHTVTLSGRTMKSVRDNTINLIKFLRYHTETRLEDVAYTTSARRTHHAWRHAATVSSTEDLVQNLERSLADESWTKCPPKSPTVVFVFTGQGSQYAGLASMLFDTCAHVREAILRMERLSVSQGFPSFLPVIIDKNPSVPFTPVQTQLALVAMELAIASLWKSLGITPAAVIGHSLGELPALCMAGVFSISTCLYLVGYRASLMMKKCSADTHAMVAVSLSAEQVDQCLRGSGLQRCAIACMNSQTSTVVAGPRDEMMALQQRLKTIQDVKITSLDVSFAFHSSQMNPILEEYCEIARKATFSAPKVTVLSTARGRIIHPGDNCIDAAYLKQQTRGSVQFLQSVKAFTVTGPRVWIEMGPQPTCLGMVRTIVTAHNEDLFLPSLKRGESDWKVLSSSLGSAHQFGLQVDWREYHRPFEPALRLLDLPSYAFDLENYWLQYEGDWSMKKGGVHRQVVQAEPVFSTTCLHHMENHTYDAESMTVTFTSDPFEPNLNAIICGHRVNGVQLCPSSLYAEMALTAARYIQTIRDPSGSAASKTFVGWDVQKMQVQSPLIVQPSNTEQIIRTSPRHVQMHATCLVEFGDADSWRSEWDQHRYLVQARMDQLIASSITGPVHRILKPMVYKLFGALVDYSASYQAIQEVFLDSKLQEATARVRLDTPSASQTSFTCNPYWIDGMAHLSGFILNGSDETPPDVVYISHGWDSIRLSVPLEEDKTYHTHVRMREVRKYPGQIMGDVYVFTDEETIALCRNVRFQRVNRSLLDHMLLSSLDTDTPDSPGTGPQQTPASTQVRDQVWRIVVNEIGLKNIAEIDNNTPLNDIGVDSLLALSIVATIKKQTGLSLPSSFFLTENPTMAAMEETLGLKQAPPTNVVKDKFPPEYIQSDMEPKAEKEIQNVSTIPEDNSDQIELHSQPVLLFSRHAGAGYRKMNLFLLPDGSGSAASYMGLLPGFEKYDCELTAVYGLNSPFLDDPDAFRDGDASVHEIASIFVESIRSIQPHGPYYLGGWSIGELWGGRGGPHTHRRTLPGCAATTP